MNSTRNFKEKELACKCGCGSSGMAPEALERLQVLRTVLGRPLILTSAYRCSQHPIEAKKAKGGTHNQGIAVDIAISNGAELYEITKVALSLGYTGIGIADTFIHLDTRKTTPVIWNY